MPPPSAPRFAAVQRGLVLAGCIGVAVLTLIDPGATRMHATPWKILLAAVQFVPFALVLFRTQACRDPVRLPPGAWSVLTAATAGALLLSAAVSPHAALSLHASLGGLSALLAFVLLYDALTEEPERTADRLLAWAGWFSIAVAVVSLAGWARDVMAGETWFDSRRLAALRNPHPLGHSNYTAGLALLAIPWLGALTWRRRGAARLGWAAGLLLVLAMLLTSGSRAGALGLCVMLPLALLLGRPSIKALLAGAVAVAVFAAAFLFVNPRTRSLLPGRPSGTPTLTASTVQRTAMLAAGTRMGLDRPLTGWGPGTTPQVYPRYRAQLDGGTENVLQLHSTPLQLWADLGLLGVAAALGFAGLAMRTALRRWGDPLTTPAVLSLAGYAVVSFFDFQLDVPVFQLALAACAALLASADTAASPRRARNGFAAITVLVLGLVATVGRPAATPRLNVRALELARDPRQADAAIALLRQSLQLDPAQEIAHFNLGWLLVVREPAAAERHFLAAARLVPDKGGVYFGLALARLNQSAPGATGADAAGITSALALECLNDPLFLTSPWWREPNLAPYRAGTFERVRSWAEQLAVELDARRDARVREAHWVAALTEWIEGTSAPGVMLALARTPERVQYFVGRPARPDFDAAAIRHYRRERLGYPVLMRDLDLPVPVDLFDVQENAIAAVRLPFLFPAKGWLPTPALRGLLDRTDSAKP